MNNFFSPSSVAIIGASNKPGKIGNDLLKNFTQEQSPTTKVFGINAKGGSFEGIEFFKSVSDLNSTPEMAVIAIPAKFVAETLHECGEKNIKNIIIISAGFKEMGNTNEEQEIQAIGEKYGMRILGPNCLGMINPKENLNLSFAGGIPKAGNIGLVSQSGAMAVALMDFATQSGMGFSKIVSMGNKCDINENDFLEYFEHDKDTDVIVLYLESLEDGRRFFELCKSITPKKPIIIVKSGISSKGSFAASSHTGALTGEKDVLFTALSQSGVHYTSSLEDLFLWSKVFSQFDIKDLPSNLAIITNAGGPGVMATDNCEKYGVELSEFSEEEEKKLQQNMPDASSMHNPIDILGDANSERYRTILENISCLEKKRNILVLLTAQTTTDTENIAQEIIQFQEKNPSQVIMAAFMGGERVQEGRKILKQAGILHFNYAKEAIKALGQLEKQKKTEENSNEQIVKKPILQEKLEKISVLQEKISKKTGLLPSEIVSEMFSVFSIPYAEEKLAKTEQEAEKIFENLGGTVVMKVSSPDIAHKTDCGGVILNISSKKEVKNSFGRIKKDCETAHPKAKIWGVTLQKQFSASREVFVGAKRDPIFGEVLLCGLGGVYVNIFEDISRRIAPISKTEIHKMIREIKAYKLLKGARGEASINFDALVDIIWKLQEIFFTFPQITDIDLNPIFAMEDNSWVIDAKIFV